MTLKEFKETVNASVSNPRQILKIMESFYETDVNDFYPDGLWTKGNPLSEIYKSNAQGRACYSLVVSDVANNAMRKELQKQQENILYYISVGSYCYVPKTYINKYKQQGGQK